MELCNNCMERFNVYLDDITITYVDGKLIYSYQGHMIDDCADGEELYISLLHEFLLTDWMKVGTTCLNKRCQSTLTYLSNSYTLFACHTQFLWGFGNEPLQKFFYPDNKLREFLYIKNEWNLVLVHRSIGSKFYLFQNVSVCDLWSWWRLTLHGSM